MGAYKRHTNTPIRNSYMQVILDLRWPVSKVALAVNVETILKECFLMGISLVNIDTFTFFCEFVSIYYRKLLSYNI